MAPLLKFSISLVLVATSALLALNNTGVSAIAVPSPVSDSVPDVKTPTAHLAAPATIPALLPIGTTLPAPAEKEQDLSKVEPMANDAKSPTKGPKAPMTPIYQRPYQFSPPARPHENIVANQKRSQQSFQWGQGGQWGQQQWDQSQWPGQQSQWPGQQSQWPGQSQWGSQTPSFGSHPSKPKKRAVTDDQDPSGADSSATDTRPFGRIGTSPTMSSSSSSSGYMGPGGPSLHNSILCHYDSQSKNTIYCSDGRVYQASRGRLSRDVYQGQTLVKRAVGVQDPQVVQPHRPQQTQSQYAPNIMDEHPILGMKDPRTRGQDPRVLVPSPQQKRFDTDNAVWPDFYTLSPEAPGIQKYSGNGGGYGGYGGGHGDWGKDKDWDKKHKDWKRQFGGAPSRPGPFGGGPTVGFGAGFGAGVGTGAGAGLEAGLGAGGVGPGPAAGSRPYSTAIPVPIDINTLVYPDGQMVLLPYDV
ncbi:hypothetical protein BG003_007750 [Podila horticola]|nr:hypothetical protein BG003_007750 [Podila horticola]